MSTQACGAPRFPEVSSRSLAAQLVEALFDESATISSVNEFDSDFSFEFGGSSTGSDNLWDATLLDEKGFPVFDETPATGAVAVVGSVTSPTPCQPFKFPARVPPG